MGGFAWVSRLFKLAGWRARLSKSILVIRALQAGKAPKRTTWVGFTRDRKLNRKPRLPVMQHGVPMR